MDDSTKLYKLKLRKNSRLELKMNERLTYNYKCSFKILSIFWNCQGLCSNRVSSAGWWGGGGGGCFEGRERKRFRFPSSAS